MESELKLQSELGGSYKARKGGILFLPYAPRGMKDSDDDQLVTNTKKLIQESNRSVPFQTCTINASN